MSWNSTKFMDSLKSIYTEHDGDDENFNRESQVLEEALQKIGDSLNYSFEIQRPINRGGSAIICEIEDFKLKTKRALKIPRPTSDQMESVANESTYLSQIRHQNIISLYAVGEVNIENQPFKSYPFFVMDFIEGGAPDLRKSLDKKIENAKSYRDFDAIVWWLAKNFLQVGKAICYLHNKDIIHFDIKPENILIDAGGLPVISDLGWAKKNSQSDKKVLVGFTSFYAHPKLMEKIKSATSENRVKNLIAPIEFKKGWDIFALGVSLLEMLSLIDSCFPQSSTFSFNFLYLHLAACRMLDGHNKDKSQIERLRREESGKVGHKSYYQTCLGLQVNDFDQGKLAYNSIVDFIDDLEKLIGDKDLLSLVPELNHYLPNRIQASPNQSYAFTKRVSTLIDSPVFCRLKKVQQLSFTSHVYPTATHTRFEHSLGVYGNTCEYIKSLYHDKYNPLFRQLVTQKDLEALLIASLAHDLGHYPLAHDIEELGEEKLSHEYWSLELLKDLNLTGWQVPLHDVESILTSRRQENKLHLTMNPKHKLLGAILNGSIDADKMDYLIRDSHECCLGYGLVVDSDRLIRNLTTIISTENVSGSEFDLGVYVKGFTAAQALSFARYLMYQTVYWHKTVRSFRAMLLKSVALAMTVPPRGKNKATFISELCEMIKSGRDGLGVTREHLLDLIAKWTTPAGKELIDMINNRIPYKRLITIHRDEIEIGGTPEILLKHRDRILRDDFIERLRKRLITRVGEFYQHVEEAAQLQPTHFDFNPVHLVNNINKELSILVDFPKPPHGARRPLHVMAEPNREQKNINLVRIHDDRWASRWWAIEKELIESAAKCRIYCHPELRNGILHAISPSEMKTIFAELLQT